MDGLKWETRLSALSLCGQLVSYALGILLARRLGVEGFEAYVVASAVFILMVSLVPQGLEKYSLKLVPPLLERGDNGRLHGYLRFARRRILLACALVAVPVALHAWRADGLSGQMRAAIVVGCLSLPAGALVHLGLELLTAAGRAFAAALVFRLLVPSLALLLVCAMLALAPAVHAPWAIAAWGAAWAVALALMLRAARRTALPAALAATAVEERAAWAAAARPFWIYRLSLALLAQAGIVAMEALQPSSSAVGGFAAAFATATIAQVLATATNRVYASRLSVLLERHDARGIARLHGERIRWLVPPLLVYLVVVFAFAPRLISLFRPEFVDDGANALRILAAATALSTLLAIFPTYLKHRGENSALFRTVAAAAIAQLVLLAMLVPAYRATGAAIAYAVATTFMYANLARLARRAHRDLPPPADPRDPGTL